MGDQGAGAGVPVWPQRPPRIRDKRFVRFVVGVESAKEVVTSRLRIAEPGEATAIFRSAVITRCEPIQRITLRPMHSLQLAVHRPNGGRRNRF
jgi:hypothetical protein